VNYKGARNEGSRHACTRDAGDPVVGRIDPGTVYGDRLNQVDFRVGKVIRYGRTRATASVDFYNALNVSTILAQNNTFRAAWQQPNSIMPARFAKVSLQFDF
jgi:acetyl/propionyl-CoA carboxylase alpha subunit